MRSPENFFWLLSQAIGHAYFLVPAAVCLAAVMLVAVGKKSDWTRSRRNDLPLLLLPAVVGLLILVCGAAFASDRYSPSDLGQNLVTLLFFLELPLAGWVVFRLPGIRVLAFLLVLPQLWFAGWAAFISVMSVRGIWL